MIPEPILESCINVQEKEKWKEGLKVERICAKASIAQYCSESSSWSGLSIVEVWLPRDGMKGDKAKKLG